MPPKTNREFGDTSFTSIPPELLEAARDLAKRQKVYLYELFAEAIEDIDAEVKAGRKIEWPVMRRGSAGRGYHTRLETETLEKLRQGATESGVNANIFFLAALRDYLRKHGQEIEVWDKHKDSASASVGATFRQRG